MSLRLANEKDLRDRLGLDDVPEIVQASRAAMISATADLAARLMTPFARATLSDNFQVSAPLDVDEYQIVTLRLRQGFVTGNVTVAASTVYSDLGAADAIASEDVQVDAEAGYVMLQTVESPAGRHYDLKKWRGMFVRVGYTAGFLSTNGLFTGVPEWLKELALLRASVVFCTMYPRYRPDEVAPETVRMMEATVRSQVADRVRAARTCEYPL